MVSKRFASVLASAVLLGGAAACAQVEDREVRKGASALDAEDSAADAGVRKPPVYREHSSVTPETRTDPTTQPPKTGGDLVGRLAKDLAGRLKVKVSELQVVAVEAVVWDDSSLGCPQPGQAYLTARVPGTRVLFLHGGKTYQYHASDRGQFIYCENPAVQAGSLDRQ